MNEQLIHGNRIELPETGDNLLQYTPIISLDVEEAGHSGKLELSEDVLSKHILIVGGIGSGKTNLFNHLIHQLSVSMTVNDIMVVFDTKGEYLKQFYRQGDIIISNDDSHFPPLYNIDYWNIFEEVLIDRKKAEENISEISKTLFYEKMQHTTNPFFPNAAKDIFYAFLLTTIRDFLNDGGATPNNHELRKYFDCIDSVSLNSLLDKYEDLNNIKYYISGKSAQSQGVFSETVQLVRDIFTGNFKQYGSLSIRKTVREKGNRRIFIEYDLGIGNVLSPIYRLLIDLAIKEALCRNKSEGNVYFILDEFRLLPYLQHIDDGINFGRSLGAKFIIGMQNIQQINYSYGENIAGSILSGFSTRFVFRVNDFETREYVKKLFGKNRYVESFYSKDTGKGIVEEVVDGNIVEDWVINKLPLGYTIFSSLNQSPKILKTYEYKGLTSKGAFKVKKRPIQLTEPVAKPSFSIKGRTRSENSPDAPVSEQENSPSHRIRSL